MTGTVPCFFRLMAPGTMWMHTLIIWIGVRNVPNPTGEHRFGRLTVLSKAPEVALSTDSVLLNRLMTYTLVLSEVTATPCGPSPTLVVTGVAPTSAASIIVTSWLPELATTTRFPLGETATPKGPDPTFTHATSGAAGAAQSTTASAAMPATVMPSSLPFP